MRKRLFVLGFGYVGKRLAAALAADGWAVAGLTRTPEAAAALAAEGFEAHANGPEFDPDLPAFRDATHMLATAQPDGDGDPVARDLGAEIAAAPRLQWLGYLSTTGVYGDLGGGEADESAPTDPTSARSRWRVLAEADWRRVSPVAHIFRLPGIYGPGRSALQQVVDGRARRIVKPGHRFNRIHVDDIVQTLIASIERPRPGAIYNVVDDGPAEPAEVLVHAARLLGREPPPAVPHDSVELSAMARSFYQDHRILLNGLIKRELGVRLRHPTYREGLAALLKDYSAG